MLSINEDLAYTNIINGTNVVDLKLLGNYLLDVNGSLKSVRYKLKI